MASSVDIGFLDYPGGDDILLRSASRATGSLLPDLLAPGMGWVFGASMALARGEGVATQNRYFVFGLSQDFSYANRRGGGWYIGTIQEKGSAVRAPVGVS